MSFCVLGEASLGHEQQQKNMENVANDDEFFGGAQFFLVSTQFRESLGLKNINNKTVKNIFFLYFFTCKVLVITAVEGLSNLTIRRYPKERKK